MGGNPVALTSENRPRRQKVFILTFFPGRAMFWKFSLLLSQRLNGPCLITSVAQTAAVTLWSTTTTSVRRTWIVTGRIWRPMTSRVLSHPSALPWAPQAHWVMLDSGRKKSIWRCGMAVPWAAGVTSGGPLVCTPSLGGMTKKLRRWCWEWEGEKFAR